MQLARASQPKPFLVKLFKIVDDAETDATVSWTAAGDALVVHDVEAFAQTESPAVYYAVEPARDGAVLYVSAAVERLTGRDPASCLAAAGPS